MMIDRLRAESKGNRIRKNYRFCEWVSEKLKIMTPKNSTETETIEKMVVAKWKNWRKK